MQNYISFYVNGKYYQVKQNETFYPLSKYLRDVLDLNGTKEVCCEGDCGACTVLLGKPKDKSFNYTPVNACILFVYQVNNCHIVTVEGLRYGDNLNPVQESMVENHGAQCGYCTPGMVTSLYALFNNKNLSEKLDKPQIQKALTGNLCRCTGYESIIDSVLIVDPTSIVPLEELYPSKTLAKISEQLYENIEISWENRMFIEPNSLEQALLYKKKYPTARLISGGTDIHVLCNKKDQKFNSIINLANIKELNNFIIDNQHVSIGASITISGFEEKIQTLYPELAHYLEFYASPQIKNVATLSGNIANASPIGDTIPFFMIMNANIELINPMSSRWVCINDFYQGYRITNIEPDEIIKTIKIPRLQPHEFLKLYKVSKRKHLDISTFSAGFKIELDGDTIRSISIAYGGVGPIVQKMRATEAYLQGKKISQEIFHAAQEIVAQEIKPISDVRASDAYRMLLAKNILDKFYNDLLHRYEETICPV